MKPIRLPDFGTPEFEVAYQRALHGDAPEVGASRTLPGTLNEAVVSYYKSLAFRELAQSSQSMRRSYLERFREQYGNSRLATMPSEFIARMMDRMEPFSARNWFKCVRAMMQHAVSTGLCKVDPTQGVKLPKVKSDGIHAWTEAEIGQFEAHHAASSKARLAFALALYTGQRRADLVRMGRQHVRDGVLEVRQQKTGTVLQIPLHAELLRVLGRPKVTEEVRHKIWDGFELEKSQTQIAAELGLSQSTVGRYLVGERANSGRLLFLTTKSGQSYSPNDFSDQFRVWCDEAGLPQHCSVHGLRKAAARRLAEAGCSAHEIAAITGHRTLKEVERYTRSAEQARLARQAMAKCTQ